MGLLFNNWMSWISCFIFLPLIVIIISSYLQFVKVTEVSKKTHERKLQWVWPCWERDKSHVRKKIRENSVERIEGEGRTKEKMRKLCEVVNNTREKAEKGRMEKRGLEKDDKKNPTISKLDNVKKMMMMLMISNLFIN